MRARSHNISAHLTIYMGGLIGEARSTSSIRDVGVIIEGNLSANASSDSGSTGIYLGGLVGLSFGNVLVKNAYVLVLNGELSVSTKSPSIIEGVGGLLGSSGLGSGTILVVEDSYVIVTNGSILRVSSDSSSFVGGLLGVYDQTQQRRAYAVINGRLVGRTVGGMVGLLQSRVFSSILASYFAAPMLNAVGADHLNIDIAREYFQFASRTLRQLECPTAAGTTCEGAEGPTYTGWNSTIWDFGDDQTLPDLRSNRRPAYINELLP